MVIRNSGKKKKKMILGEARKGRRQAQTQCTPLQWMPQLLCKWPGTMISTNRKSKARIQKWNSIS